jgi:hypothetical protein
MCHVDILHFAIHSFEPACQSEQGMPNISVVM